MRKALYILGHLNDTDVDWLARAGTRRRIAAGQVVIREGQAIDSLFITLDGKLLVTVAGNREIAHLSVGEVIGEIAFVDSAPPSATVSTIGEVVVLELKKVDLERKLAEDLGFAARFYRALAVFLADRLRAATHGLGYGMDSDHDLQGQSVDELDMGVLDTVSIAGQRFERLLRTLASG